MAQRLPRRYNWAKDNRARQARLGDGMRKGLTYLLFFGDTLVTGPPKSAS